MRHGTAWQEGGGKGDAWHPCIFIVGNSRRPQPRCPQPKPELGYWGVPGSTAHRPTSATGGERERMRWENQPRALRGATADGSGCLARQ